MPRRRSIYVKLYSWLSAVALLFFAHNALRHAEIDMLHLNQPVCIEWFGWQWYFYVKDAFPFYDAKANESLDIQVYVYRLSMKLVCLILSVGIMETLRTLNLFLKEIPGRSCHNLIAFTACFVGLFAYETVDFLLACAQSSWIVQALAFLTACGTALTLVKDR